MATLLIMRGADPRAVELRRVGAWTRLLARTRSWTLDWALAGGASPDSSTALSLRAHVLISATHRRGLARELRGALAAAARPPHPFDPTVRVPHQVLLARDSTWGAITCLHVRS
jgi:hypothetical protein